jgi:N-acetylglucosaminyldiphosphoundecaprenol N-acetyl-beta-D-mannosaminyltransferase
MTPQTSTARAIVVGVPVDAISMDDVVRTILAWTAQKETRVGVGVNANVCNLAASDRRFRANLAAADLAYADGQSVVWAARLLGHAVPERIATTDLIHPLADACVASHKKIYLFGGEPGIAAKAATRLTELHPGLSLVSHDGYVAEERMPDLIREINQSGADVLLVGLGDPLQQQWIADHRSALAAHAVLSCGGLFDWVSGSNRRAPAWMISAGLEWLWRLMLEPRRLGRRYLVGNPAFLARLALALVRQRPTRARHS